jgi:hypothetical protein
MAKRPFRNNKSLNPRRMLRPEAVVLSDAALVPQHNLIKPPPNQFTHELQRSQPYFYKNAEDALDGEFTAGTRVVLMVYDGGGSCRVVDGRGLYVETAYGGLHRL